MDYLRTKEDVESSAKRYAALRLKESRTPSLVLLQRQENHCRRNGDGVGSKALIGARLKSC